MSKFEVRIRRVNSVSDHPNADRLSLNKVDGFTVISNKHEDGSHRYHVGQPVIYIPENALVPEELLRHGYWNEEKNIGYLAGPLGNRVKPAKLRGIVSEGIVFPVTLLNSTHVIEYKLFDKTLGFVPIGEAVGWEDPDPLDVSHAETLGITKWEPEIPSSMSGDVFNASGVTMNFDVENIKKNVGAIEDGENVVMTEKLHGTNCQIVIVNDREDENFIDGKYVVASKGLGAKGLAFKNTEENRKGNLYVRTFLKEIDKFKRFDTFFSNAKKVHFIAEIYGKGVQDLGYNLNEPRLAIIDIFIDGVPMDYVELQNTVDHMGLDLVPVLYSGPFSEEALETHTKGTTSINGAHVKEGVVVKPVIERRNDNGRVHYKSINEAYLLRKGNQTEYQ